jgi:hypothetical protein
MEIGVKLANGTNGIMVLVHAPISTIQNSGIGGSKLSNQPIADQQA